MPVSACTPGCLPGPGALPTVGRLRVTARLLGMLALVAAAVPLAVVLPLLPGPGRGGLLRAMFRGMLRLAGVRLVHSGAARFVPTAEELAAAGGPSSGCSGDRRLGVLMVANHLSWLDILVLGAVQPMRMVAKREIRDWPVLGALAARAGTLFVDRCGLRSLPALVTETAAALRGGAVVGLFPEGTTWCGAASGSFRRAGFQAALDAGVPVRPVAQRMRLADGTSTGVGAFVGEDTLVASLLRVVRLPELVVEVEVLPPLVAEPGTDRRALARRAELVVALATGVPAPAAPARPAVRRPLRPADGPAGTAASAAGPAGAAEGPAARPAAPAEAA
jgi:1-acyl-sn-glycerol-3-phosphate acyltransferase